MKVRKENQLKQSIRESISGENDNAWDEKYTWWNKLKIRSHRRKYNKHEGMTIKLIQNKTHT